MVELHYLACFALACLVLIAVALTALIAPRSVGRRNEQVGVGAIENNNGSKMKGGKEHFISPRAVHSAFYILIRLASHHITLKPKQFSRGGGADEGGGRRFPGIHAFCLHPPTPHL